MIEKVKIRNYIKKIEKLKVTKSITGFLCQYVIGSEKRGNVALTIDSELTLPS